jgi:hypothetical protein
LQSTVDFVNPWSKRSKNVLVQRNLRGGTSLWLSSFAPNQLAWFGAQGWQLAERRVREPSAPT